MKSKNKQSAWAENSPDLWLGCFPWPMAENNKYDRGHAIIGGGTPASAGASKIAALCALRSGAGLVSVACDSLTLPAYAASFQAVMTKLTENEQDFSRLVEDKRVTAILLGPGAGITIKTKAFVLSALARNKTVVLDADVFSVFADSPEVLFAAIKSPCILTPHEGEFRQLFGSYVKDGDKVSHAHKAAALSNAVVLLKGSDTVIAGPDGRIAVNRNAPPWLATAGSGDALAGICAGLLAQGMPAFETACAAAWIHADAAARFGPGLIAEDIAGLLPQVLQALKGYKPQ